MYLRKKIYRSAGCVPLHLLVLFGLVFLPSQILWAATCNETATDAASIQTLITAAPSGRVICVPSGTYSVNLTLKAGVILQGDELAQTIFQGVSNITPIITGATNAVVQNVLLQGAGSVGISATDITGLTVRNVIFSSVATGITADNSSLTVANAVFYMNGTAITCQSNSTLTLNNSIINKSTTTDLNLTDTTETFANNLLFDNTDPKYPLAHATSVYADPLFVAPASNDFHLKDASPAKNAGTGTDPDASDADIGAYGGANADVTPFRVSGLTITVNAVDSATVNWSTNIAYNISSYKVYFDLDASGKPYAGTSGAGNSPVAFSQPDPLPGAPEITLTGLGLDLAAPTDLITVPGNGTVLVSWEAVPNATGYEVSYGTTSGTYTTTVDAGTSLIYQINGLENFVEVFITVSAYYLPTLYVSVTAVDDSVDLNESVLSTEATKALSVTNIAGTSSSEVSETPEPTVTFPNLKDEQKCFIATAAYGSSLEPQVVVLRKFRNHFLLTNAFGRRFVALYYQLSPPAASFISAHGWLKPVVQAGLYPFVGLAWCCLKAGPVLLLFIGLGFFISLLVLRVYGRTNTCA